MNTNPLPTWFGDFQFAIGEARFWQIGPLRLVLRRNAHEWQAARARKGGALEDALRVAESDVPLDMDDADVTRFGFRTSPDRVDLVPCLADRPVVVDTAKPFVLPPEQEVTLYLSTPLWLQIQLEDTVVLDEAIHRPSDTWFGPDTQVGELCYASTTSVRLELANLPLRPHRATTAVVIHNRAATNVELKSLKFPMPHLSLFVNEQGSLWTETLTYDREHDDEDATVQLEKAPPGEAGSVRRITSARDVATRSFLTRVFGGLLELGR